MRIKIFFLILIVSVFSLACPFKKAKFKDVFKQVVSIKQKTSTPKGVKVWIQDGVVYDGFDAASIDVGIGNLIKKTNCLPYQNLKVHSNYIVALLKSTETSSDGFPAYRLPCAQYCGTVFDKGGYILVSGQILVNRTAGVLEYIAVIPDHTPAQVEHLKLIVEYEAEHLILFANDRARFEATQTHTETSGHPIINDCQNKTDTTQHEQKHLPYDVVLEINGKDVKFEGSVLLAE